MSGPFSDYVIASQERRRKVIAALDALAGGDPEASHIEADDIILSFLGAEEPDLLAAYNRVVDRENGRWWFA